MLRQAEDLSIFFFNEINRARPQVHALLLRLMAERTVTAFEREWRFPFSRSSPTATGSSGRRPSNSRRRRDRFLMEIGMEAPREAEARRALAFDPRFHDTDRLIAEVAPGVLDHCRDRRIAGSIQHAVEAAPEIEAYVVALWDALLRPAEAGIRLADVDMGRLVQGGASPPRPRLPRPGARVRAWLEGRAWLVPEDIRAIFPR